MIGSDSRTERPSRPGSGRLTSRSDFIARTGGAVDFPTSSEDWSNATPRPDEIGISPSLSPKFPLLSVPYGCLVPRDIDGLLVAGRHISCDPSSHSFLRKIPQCWLTG